MASAASDARLEEIEHQLSALLTLEPRLEEVENIATVADALIERVGDQRQALTDLRNALADMRTSVNDQFDSLRRTTGALVVERADGTVIAKASGVDWKTVGLCVTGIAVPLVVAILTAG